MSVKELGIDFQMPKNQSSQIKVMGIGGGGSNAVNYMFEHGIKGVDFVICNTDAQALEASPVPIRIQLGADLTEGLGAGSNPDVGRLAAEESAERITELLDSNTKMLFVTAGMGGGTGTGAAPVIAEIAKDKGILTVGVVTVPFATEGGYRRQYADEGITELKKYVDTLLVIDNEKLIEVYGDLTFTSAFAKANEVLNTATKGIAEVISQHLIVNIDLNDARKVLENSGTAVMGQSEAEGENRAIEAVIGALDSPLLNDNDITGAKQVLLKIVTGKGEGEIRMSELSKIKNKIQEAAGNDVNIIEGIGVDPDLGDTVSVTVIATGFEQKKKPKIPKTITLDNDKDLEDIITEENVLESSVKDIKSNQQILDLEEEIIENSVDETGVLDSQDIVEFTNEVINEEEEIIENSVDEIGVLDNQDIVEFTNEVINEEEVISPTVENIAEKVVFDLENSGSNPLNKEESAEQLISSIIESDNIKEDNEENSAMTLDLDGDEIIGEEDKLNTIESNEVNTDSMKIEARERENRLRAISQKLRTPSGLTDLEDVPAYQRNNIELEPQTHSSQSESSSYSLDEVENNRTELKQNNSFLHDNVD